MNHTLIPCASKLTHGKLNDRALARRPWVCDPQYAETDRLLPTTAPACRHFNDRLFAEPFAARYLLRPAPSLAPTSDVDTEPDEAIASS